MILIPAIDLKGGGVVRLQQGDFGRETRYSVDALELARRYEEAGAGLVHVVDLDAARAGGDANLDRIGRICEGLSIPVQTGGGVRGQADLEARLGAGAARVVIGSLCVRDPDRVCRWITEFGPETIVAGLDVQRGSEGGWIPRAAGWTESGRQELGALVKRLADAGLRHLLCTDIERDGMYSGPSIELYRGLAERFSGLEVQASGGIGVVSQLTDVARTGVAGCIVGRALLEGRIPLSAIGRNWGEFRRDRPAPDERGRV